jgi:hypothetical protein
MFISVTVTVFENEIICGDRFDSNDTVLSLKLKIQEKISLHPRKQILSWEDIQLEDFRSLVYYDFNHDHVLLTLTTQDVNFKLNLLTDYLLQLDAGHPQNEDFLQKCKRGREGWMWTNYLIKYPDRGSKEQEEERVRFALTTYFKNNDKDAKQIKKEYLFWMNEVEDTTANLAILKEVMQEVRPKIKLIESYQSINPVIDETFNLELLFEF